MRSRVSARFELRIRGVRGDLSFCISRRTYLPGLDFDGPSASTNTSQAGYLNLLEPLISFAPGKTTDEGDPDARLHQVYRPGSLKAGITTTRP